MIAIDQVQAQCRRNRWQQEGGSAQDRTSSRLGTSHIKIHGLAGQDFQLHRTLPTFCTTTTLIAFINFVLLISPSTHISISARWVTQPVSERVPAMRMLAHPLSGKKAD